MKQIKLFCFIAFLTSAKCLSQGSDFILLKKNRHTKQSFFTGSPLQFETNNGSYSGRIEEIKKDSLYLIEYVVSRIPTNLGVFILDTVATYRYRFHYKEITSVVNQKKKGFDWRSSGATLFGGGVLLTALGLGTWVFTKPATEYYASPQLVIASALLAASGYLLLKNNSDNFKMGDKYHLEYIKVR